MYKHAALREKRRLPVAGTENGKLRFSESCICIHGRVKGKVGIHIKRWEEMRKVRLIMFSAVCTETACESVLPFCGENYLPFKSRRYPGCADASW